MINDSKEPENDLRSQGLRGKYDIRLELDGKTVGEMEEVSWSEVLEVLHGLGAALIRAPSRDKAILLKDGYIVLIRVK